MDNGKTFEFIKGMVIGGALGAIAGMLFAPKSGSETRQDISKMSDEFLGKAQDEYEVALKKSKKAYESAVDKMKELETLAKEKYDEMEGKVEELKVKGKETVEQSKSRLKKAIDAGVDAFKTEKENAG